MQWIEPGDVSLMPSTAFTTTRTLGPFHNKGCRGLWLFLDVTANPGGAETLTLAVQIYDSFSAKARTVTAFSATSAATNATYAYLIYPAAVITSAATNVAVQAVPVPRNFEVTITPSSTGSWTATLDGLWVP